MIGRLIDRGLHTFAAWAVRRGEAFGIDNATHNATDADPMRGYVIPDYNTGEPYITRVLLPRLRAFGLNVRPMLHHIHRADHERDLHDHPWAWSLSIILRGSYDEERPRDCHHVDCSRTETRRVRWFNFIRGTDVHRITALHGEVWTLFITGPRTKSWGFREWDPSYERYDMTPNKEYIARRKVEKTFSGHDWYNYERADVDGASGELLDRWGEMLNIPRREWIGESPDGQCVPHYSESDEEYRERLVAKLRS